MWNQIYIRINTNVNFSRKQTQMKDLFAHEQSSFDEGLCDVADPKNIEVIKRQRIRPQLSTPRQLYKKIIVAKVMCSVKNTFVSIHAFGSTLQDPKGIEYPLCTLCRKYLHSFFTNIGVLFFIFFDIYNYLSIYDSISFLLHIRNTLAIHPLAFSLVYALQGSRIATKGS